MKQSEKSFELLEENFKFSVKWFDIVSLVVNLNNLATKMDKDTEKELFETYYYGLGQQKITGFTINILTVTNKMKLYSYLLKEKLISDEKVDKTSSSLTKMIDGEPVNINPLSEMSIPEMRLYYVDKNYFKSIDELLMYCRMSKISTERLNVLDYYISFAGRSDVIRKSNSQSSMLYTVVDENGYGLYNNIKSVYRGEFIWEYNYGSIRELYIPFKEKGIIFDNDVYEKIDENQQQFLKYCKENNLFNIEKK